MHSGFLCYFYHFQMIRSLKKFLKEDFQLQAPDVMLIRLLNLTWICWNTKTWALNFN